MTNQAIRNNEAAKLEIKAKMAYYEDLLRKIREALEMARAR